MALDSAPFGVSQNSQFFRPTKRAGWRFPPDCWRYPPRRGGGIRVKQRLRLCLTHNFTPERRQVRPLPFQCKQLIAIFIPHCRLGGGSGRTLGQGLSPLPPHVGPTATPDGVRDFLIAGVSVGDQAPLEVLKQRRRMLSAVVRLVLKEPDLFLAVLQYSYPTAALEVAVVAPWGMASRHFQRICAQQPHRAVCRTFS